MEKWGLGKGLGALLSDSLAPEDAGVVREVPIAQIGPNPYQPREVFDPNKLAEMVQSIREHGVLQPVLLRRVGVDRFELIAGERRVRAARESGLRSVPAIIREYGPEQMLEVALIENLQREDINPVEAAHAYFRLRDEFGLTQEAIAQRVGKAPSTIANTLRLLALPEPIQQSIAQGEITEGHARALLQAAPEAQFTAWQDIKRRGLSVREAERLTRTLRGTRNSPGGNGKRGRSDDGVRPRNPNDASVEEALQTALGTKVLVRRTGKTGRIEIEFYSEEHLESVVERMLGEGRGA